MRSYQHLTKAATHRTNSTAAPGCKTRAVSAPPYVFQVLDTLDTEQINSQRQLAAATGISLGQVNATLHRLMEKRLVSIGHLAPGSGRVQRVYRLTNKGKQVRAKLAVSFVTAHLEEIKRLKSRLVSRLKPLLANSRRVVILGPEEIKNFVSCTISTEGLDLQLVEHCPSTESLRRLDARDFDLVLFFDTAQAGLDAIARASGLSPKRFVSLW